MSNLLNRRKWPRPSLCFNTPLVPASDLGNLVRLDHVDFAPLRDHLRIYHFLTWYHGDGHLWVVTRAENRAGLTSDGKILHFNADLLATNEIVVFRSESPLEEGIGGRLALPNGKTMRSIWNSMRMEVWDEWHTDNEAAVVASCHIENRPYGRAWTLDAVHSEIG